MVRKNKHVKNGLTSIAMAASSKLWDLEEDLKLLEESKADAIENDDFYAAEYYERAIASVIEVGSDIELALVWLQQKGIL